MDGDGSGIAREEDLGFSPRSARKRRAVARAAFSNAREGRARGAHAPTESP